MHPLSLYKAGKPQFDGIYDCIATTIKNQGITGLYRGTSVSIAGAFVYRAGQLEKSFSLI